MEIKAAIILLALILHGCGAGAVSPVTTLRCPATPPARPVCSQACPPWPAGDRPAQIEALQRDYLKGRAAHKACAVEANCRERRDRVWRESWEACGRYSPSP